MVTGYKPNLQEYRIRASRLLKDLESGDPAAAARLRHAPEWAGQSIEQILAVRASIRRKHALRAIAFEAGFSGWTELKQRLENAFDPAALFDRAGGAFLNRWFRTYEEARASLDRDGGFLFPYHKHFVVCEGGFLEASGIDPGDPDWERIGRDWVKPADTEARRRLSTRQPVTKPSPRP
ncbi:MAG: hypothetical protein SFV51_22435 [Bryobacteraceae bacterium]|nr:hypothetical protein [Bryobacteraceae bacterium]